MLVIVIAVLVTLGPIRLAESTSTEVSSCARSPADPTGAREKPWSWPQLAVYYDALAWGGYSLRELALDDSRGPCDSQPGEAMAGLALDRMGRAGLSSRSSQPAGSTTSSSPGSRLIKRRE